MVVCRYFLQGYCKFGDRCRYQHFQDNRSPSPGGNYHGHHNRSWHAPNHGPSPGRAGSPVGNGQVPQAGPSSLNPLDLAEAIKADVLAMEEGRQWPLTCYTPSKDFGGFPGFHDTSMEEVRYEAYQAQSSGTFDQYVKKFENLIQATRMKWGMLKNPTGQVMSVIEKMASGQGLRAESPSSSGLSSFSFAASFNSPHQQQPPPPSGFSLGGNAAFGVAQSSGSIFSTGAPHSPPPIVPNSSFTFTLPPQSTSSPPFGSSSAGHTNPPPPSFGAVPSAFGQSGGLLFGASSHMAPSNIQQPPQPISSGFFGGAPSSGKEEGLAFGAAPSQAPPAFGSSVAGFGASAFFPSKTEGAAAQPPPAQSIGAGIYTPLADLSEPERKEFTAVTFTLGCVPLRPPPSELCV